MTGDGVALIVAAVDTRSDLSASLRLFHEMIAGRGQVYLLDGTPDGSASLAARVCPGVVVLRSPSGSLAPELWGDGLAATSEPIVALTTSRMAPAPGWLDAMLGRLETSGAAAVGGSIEPDDGLCGLDLAVYLLRYINYLRPIPRGVHPEPPGDNAIYRRDRLRVEGRGFWESEVHRDLRDRGETLAFEPVAALIFQGGCRFRSILRQRFLHARHYGSARASRFSVWGKLERTAATPLVAPVLLGRVVSSLRKKGERLRPWLSALPWLVPLLAAWTLGEAVGVWLGPPAVRRPRPVLEEMSCPRSVT